MHVFPPAQTQSLTCHEACQSVVWRLGQAKVDTKAKESAIEACEQSPELLHCLRELTASTVLSDTSKCKQQLLYHMIFYMVGIFCEFQIS